MPQRPTILHIDDDPTCWQLVQALAKRYAPSDWQLLAVDSIEAAAAVLQGYHVMVVLLDLNLGHTGGTSGLLSLRRLRELITNIIPERSADIPIIIVTGGDESEKPQSMALGAVGFVTKHTMVDDPPAFFAFLGQIIEEQAFLYPFTDPPSTGARGA